MSTYIESRNSEKEWFVHFTYSWHEKSIAENGLAPSIAGQMGKGIYCCSIQDQESGAIDRAIKFMKDELNWRILADHLGLDDVDEIDDFIDLDSIIVPVYFCYSGAYLYGLPGHEGINIDGYVAIQVERIPAEFLTIGLCLEDDCIESQLEYYEDPFEEEPFVA